MNKVEVPQVSDTTDDDSIHSAKYIIKKMLYTEAFNKYPSNNINYPLMLLLVHPKQIPPVLL